MDRLGTVVHRVEPWRTVATPCRRRESAVVRRVDDWMHRAQKCTPDLPRRAHGALTELTVSPRRSGRPHGAKPAWSRYFTVLGFFTVLHGAP